ncbi:hypothetical protein EDB84DRAFT_636462 [Lactarius hengduanensis]|nr:hypothetical protein EDB84DRAFT_636462 [Lactarius hengduanensis]
MSESPSGPLNRRGTSSTASSSSCWCSSRGCNGNPASPSRFGSNAMGTEGGGAFGSGSGGSGRTLGLPLPLDLSLSLDPFFVSVPSADADVGVGGSGCVGGGDSGGPSVKRCCAERGRGRRGASMSSELKNGSGGACARGSTGSTRLPPLPRVPPELPLSRAARPGRPLRMRSRMDRRRAGGSGGGLFEGGGGGRGELGRDAVDCVGSAGASASVETGRCCAARRLCTRLCHSTVNTTNSEAPRTMGTIAAASTPPEGLRFCCIRVRYLGISEDFKARRHTCWESGRALEEMCHGRYGARWLWRKERVGGKRCSKAGSDRNMIPAPGAE